MLFVKMRTVKCKIKQYTGLYGLRGAFLRVLKGVIYRCVGFRWERCYLMSRSLDTLCPFSVRSDLEVRELSLSDYDNVLWHGFLTEEKRRLYEERFKEGKAKAYGVFVNGTLACSAWILYGRVIFTEKNKLFENEACALLFDDYCLPAFRGNGLHGYLNQWRLKEMKVRGVQKAYVIVLSYNRPAIKTQHKCGLDIEKVFYTYTFGEKVFVKM